MVQYTTIYTKCLRVPSATTKHSLGTLLQYVLSVYVFQLLVRTLGKVLSQVFFYRVSPLNTRYMTILMYRVFVHITLSTVLYRLSTLARDSCHRYIQLTAYFLYRVFFCAKCFENARYNVNSDDC
jgi:hypothetical protein